MNTPNNQDHGRDRSEDRGDGGTAAPEGAARNFRRRVASASVLAPLVIAATYFGGWAFMVLCTLAAVAVLWEWTMLVARKPEPRIIAPGLASLVVAAGLLGVTEPTAAIAAIAVGTLLVGGLVAFWPGCELPPFWAAGGVIYAGVVLLSPALLRNDPHWGFQALLFLFAVVWATDIFAYLIGRGVGGPLLWPRVSPNKTWSGAMGGLLGGVAAGIAVAYASGGTRAAIAGVLALVLSIVAQGGDLFESAIKRRFGVKDTSHLIPGHGGVMDRLDGFLVAALAAVLIGILRQGVAAPARGLLAW